MKYICPECGKNRWHTKSKEKKLYQCRHCGYIGKGVIKDARRPDSKALPQGQGQGDQDALDSSKSESSSSSDTGTPKEGVENV